MDAEGEEAVRRTRLVQLLRWVRTEGQNVDSKKGRGRAAFDGTRFPPQPLTPLCVPHYDQFKHRDKPWVGAGDIEKLESLGQEHDEELHAWSEPKWPNWRDGALDTGYGSVVFLRSTQRSS